MIRLRDGQLVWPRGLQRKTAVVVCCVFKRCGTVVELFSKRKNGIFSALFKEADVCCNLKQDVLNLVLQMGDRPQENMTCQRSGKAACCQ